MTDSPGNGSAVEIIADEDWLYRRLALNHFRSDGTVNRTAFMWNSLPPGKGKEPDPQVSVDLVRLTDPPYSPSAALATARRPNQGIGALQARFPRDLGLDVLHDPIVDPPDMANRAHSLIQGNASDRAMELCELMAEELSKHILIHPEGSPWRTPSTGRPDH